MEGRALEPSEAGVHAGQKLGRGSGRAEWGMEGVFHEVGHRGHGVFLTYRRTDPVSTHVKNKGAKFLTIEEEVTDTKGD